MMLRNIVYVKECRATDRSRLVASYKLEPLIFKKLFIVMIVILYELKKRMRSINYGCYLDIMITRKRTLPYHIYCGTASSY